MHNLTAKTGYDREEPSEEDLLAYGQLTFLAWTSEGAFRNCPGYLYTATIHGPVNLGFYHVFHEDGQLSGFYTYAFLDTATAARTIIAPGRWDISSDDGLTSGNDAWMIDFVAKTSHAAIPMFRHLRQSPDAIDTIRSLRVFAKRPDEARIWVHTRHEGDVWANQIMTVSEFLSSENVDNPSG